MKNIRVFFRKFGRMKFVSHLDMNRYMTRVIKISKIPAWYTEGFNQHPYITFALPLSLGFQSDYEIIDLRLTDDDYELEKVIAKLQEASIEGIEFFDIAEPVMKVGKIAFCCYELLWSTENDVESRLLTLLKSESVIVKKKGKKGKISAIDIIPMIKDYTISREGGYLKLKVTVPAGGSDNLNPSLIVKAFCEKSGIENINVVINRIMLYNEQMEIFK